MTITCHLLDADGQALREVPAQAGRSLMRSLKDAGLDIEASCEGSMACGTCLVHLDEAWFARLPAPAPDEAALLDWLDGRRPTSRLACQIRVEQAMDGLRLAIAA
jgi:ferredoxin